MTVMTMRAQQGAPRTHAHWTSSIASVELEILGRSPLTGPLPSNELFGRLEAVQSGNRDGTKPLEAQQASTCPLPHYWHRSLGRTLPPYSFAVAGPGSSSGRSRLKQRPPNSSHLQGRPKGRANLRCSVIMPWEQASPKLGPLGLQAWVLSSFAAPLEASRRGVHRSTTNLTKQKIGEVLA